MLKPYFLLVIDIKGLGVLRLILALYEWNETKANSRSGDSRKGGVESRFSVA
jgi:hypothetical protein